MRPPYEINSLKTLYKSDDNYEATSGEKAHELKL